MSSVYISLHYASGKEVSYTGYERAAVSEWKVVSEHPLVLANKKPVQFAKVLSHKGEVNSFGICMYKDDAPVLDAPLDTPLELELDTVPGICKRSLSYRHWCTARTDRSVVHHGSASWCRSRTKTFGNISEIQAYSVWS